MAYDNTNQGALFRNKKKVQDNHPDYTGTINVNGVEYWLSSWMKISKIGEKYMSMSLTPKVAGPVADNTDLDDLPF